METTDLCNFINSGKFINHGTINIYCCCCGKHGSGSGTGSCGAEENRPFKLVREPHEVIGLGFHRSGWPYVFQHLQRISSNDGNVLLDDFVEQNFCYNENPVSYDQPWVGIFHHTPHVPWFGNQKESLLRVFDMPEFQESLKHMLFGVALSEHLGSFLRKHLNIPILVVKHPIGIPDKKWSLEKFDANKKRKIVQIGYYLRNTRFLEGLPLIEGYDKIRLWSNLDWVQQYDKKVYQHLLSENNLLFVDPSVEDKMFLPPSQFDELLSENVAAMYVFDSSANNGVLDCIVRNTPIYVNPHPAIIEYLGSDYPLYHGVNKLNTENIIKAHHYLRSINKDWTSGYYFISKIMDFYEKVRS